MWIGGNYVIFPGVTIGKNVTIGAGYMANKDLTDNILAHINLYQVIQNL